VVDVIDLGTFPIALMLLALVIPIAYCLKWKKPNLRKAVLILIYCIFIVILYPITTYLANIIEPTLGYFLGKLILFTLLPFVTILYLERWKIKTTLMELGIKKEKLLISIILGLGVLLITVVIALLIYGLGQTDSPSAYWNTIMFFDAFNEEFLFRGVLFLYLWKITDLKIAYATSVLAFILAHPQNFTSLYLISTAAQGIFLGIVTYKTKNLIGPWISHGLNRVIPQIISALL
jgi:membrane protease YdiL (CAAX protease family)